MPFDWMHPEPPPHLPGRFQDQFVRGIRERARLLCHLRFDQQDAVRRIQNDLRWEFDDGVAFTPLPDFYSEIPTLVEQVYSHQGRSQKPTPKAKPKKRKPRKRR